MKVSIYTLTDPITSEVKYVGTTCNLINRYNKHISTPHKSISGWIYSLRNLNETPIMHEVFVCDSMNEAVEIEGGFIELYSKKHNLFNLYKNKKRAVHKLKKYDINYLSTI